MSGLTDQAAEDNPDLIVWPETATPCYLKKNRSYLSRVMDQVNRLGIPLLTGTPDYEFISTSEYRTYNSAILIQPNHSVIQTYTKMRARAVWRTHSVRRFVSFQSNKIACSIIWKWDRVIFRRASSRWFFQFRQPLENAISDSMASKMKAAAVIKGIKTGLSDTAKFAVAICYESVFSQLVGEFVRRGAQFITVMTNDAWFGRTAMPEQHVRIAVIRAIENRIAIARCANTGISCFIDPYGRIISETETYTEAILTESIPLLTEQTFFTPKWKCILRNCIDCCRIKVCSLRFLSERSKTGV